MEDEDEAPFYSRTIREIDEDSRPRERLLKHGAEVLIRHNPVPRTHARRQFHVLPAERAEVPFDCAANLRVAHGRSITLRTILPFHEQFAFGVAGCG